MIATIKPKELFEAFCAVDPGVSTSSVQLYGGATVRRPALAWLSAHGKALRIDTQIGRHGSEVRLSYLLDADLDEEGEAVLRLEDLRGSLAKLKKCRLKNELVEVKSDSYRGAKAVVMVHGSARVRIDQALENSDGLLPLCSATCGRITHAEIDAMAGSLASISPTRYGDDGTIAGASAGICGGSALIMDRFTADLISLPRVSGIETAIPRIAIAALRKTGLDVGLSTCGAVSGPLSVAWRLGDCDTALRLARSIKNVTRALQDAKPVTIHGDALRQALREISAFCKSGDAIRLLPNEAGIKLLRYDCKDRPGADLSNAPCAETLCEADWPIPRPMTVSGKVLKKALGDADSLEMYATAEDGDPVAVRVPDSQVFRIMCECPCVFKKKTSI